MRLAVDLVCPFYAERMKPLRLSKTIQHELKTIVVNKLEPYALTEEENPLTSHLTNT